MQRRKDGVFTPEMLVQQPRSVNEVKAESRRLLAETIKNDEARELARYLSLVTGPFDREFALNIGNAVQGLKEPGRALDTLVGPWIESLGNDVYSLSPLLRGYAEADAGKNMLKKYYVILCVAWLKKRTLTPFRTCPGYDRSSRCKIRSPYRKAMQNTIHHKPRGFQNHIQGTIFYPSFVHRIRSPAYRHSPNDKVYVKVFPA